MYNIPNHIYSHRRILNNLTKAKELTWSSSSPRQYYNTTRTWSTLTGGMGTIFSPKPTDVRMKHNWFFSHFV